MCSAPLASNGPPLSPRAVTFCHETSTHLTESGVRQAAPKFTQKSLWTVSEQTRVGRCPRALVPSKYLLIEPLDAALLQHADRDERTRFAKIHSCAPSLRWRPWRQQRPAQHNPALPAG